MAQPLPESVMMIFGRLLSRTAPLLALLALGACSGSGAADGSGTTVDSADGELDIPRRKGPPYRAVAVQAAGTITGAVAAPSPPPVAPASGPCAGRAVNSPAPVVVYLEDIPSGRAMPDGTPRRYEVKAGSCEIVPRVAIAPAGATLNLSNDVKYVHHVAFVYEGMKNPMLKVPFSDPGQLVPSERVLAVPGIVEVRSDQDPSVRAQLVVVEHPYAVETTDGTFTLDSVPPGTYTLVAIGAQGRAEAKVEVRAGTATNVNLELK